MLTNKDQWKTFFDTADQSGLTFSRFDPDDARGYLIVDDNSFLRYMPDDANCFRALLHLAKEQGVDLIKRWKDYVYADQPVDNVKPFRRPTHIQKLPNKPGVITFFEYLKSNGVVDDTGNILEN